MLVQNQSVAWLNPIMKDLNHLFDKVYIQNYVLFMY